MTLLSRFVAASRTLEYIELGADGTVLRVNAAFASHIGAGEASVRGESIARFTTAADAERLAGWMETGAAPADATLLNFVQISNVPYTLRCLVERTAAGLAILGETPADSATADDLMRLNNEFATLTRELERRSRQLERTKQELTEALERLRTSYWHLEKLQEVLPVCMGCGHVKSGGADWQPLLDYLRSNDMLLSHGYCPACLDSVLNEHGLRDEG